MWKSPMENSFPHFAPRPDRPRNRPDMSPQQQQNQHQLQQQYHHHHRQLQMQMIPPHSGGGGGGGGYLPPPQSSNNNCGNHQQFFPNSVVATQHQPHMNSSSLEPPHMNAPSNVATGIPVVPQHSQNFPQQQQQQQQMTLNNNSSNSNSNSNGISFSPQQQVVLNQAFSLVTSIQNPTVLFHVSSFLQLMHNLLQATPQTNNIPQGGFPSQNAAAAAAAPPLPPSGELGSQNGSCFQPGANFPAKFPAQNPSSCSEDNMVVPNQFQIPNQLNPMCSPVSLNPMFPFTKSFQANGTAEILPNNMCWQGAGVPAAQQNHGQLQQHQMPQQGRLSGSQVPQSDSSSPHQGKKPDCHGADAVQPVNGKVNNGPFNQQFSSNGNFKNGPSRFQKQNERSKDSRSSLDALHNKNSFQALSKGSFSEASETNVNRKMKNRERNHDLQCSPLKRMRILKTSELSGENKQWREERKKNYPTDLNIQRKAEELQQKLARGELIDEDAKKRRQRLREILAKQAELGIEVADIPAQYLKCDGANKDSDDTVEEVAKLSQNSSNDKIKKGPKVCYLFQKGRCKNGRRCRFLHERKPSSREQDPPALQSSTRKPTLLEKLLEKDIKMERSHLLQWSKEPPTTEPQKDAEKHILSHLQPVSSGSDNTANNTEQASSDSEDMQEKNASKKRSSSVDNSKAIDTTGKSLDEDGCTPKSAADEDSSSSGEEEDVEEGEILDHEHEKQ